VSIASSEASLILKSTHAFLLCQISGQCITQSCSTLEGYLQQMLSTWLGVPLSSLTIECVKGAGTPQQMTKVKFIPLNVSRGAEQN
jgi:hypothetical protein